MIRVKQRGDFNNTLRYFGHAKAYLTKIDIKDFAERCNNALKEATPKDTGKTSKSWQYEIVYKKDKCTISFHNTNVQDGVPIAVVLQYGHITETGYYIPGIDYINPALKPLFEEVTRNAWKEVTRV